MENIQIRSTAINTLHKILMELLGIFYHNNLEPELILVNSVVYKLLCNHGHRTAEFKAGKGVESWEGIRLVCVPLQEQYLILTADIGLNFTAITTINKYHAQVYKKYVLLLESCKDLQVGGNRIMKKPDRSVVENLIVDTVPEKPKKIDKHFKTKLDNGDFSSFTEKDWISYFKEKASAKGVKYISNTIKDKAVFKSVMSNFKPLEIKIMIDYVFDSNQDVVDIKTCGVWILSKGWLNTVYNNSIIWKEGKTSKRKRRESKHDSGESKVFI